MPKSLFSPEILARATLSDAAAAKFRDEAKMRVVTDEESRQRVVFYVHPDGRILLDAIRAATREAMFSQPIQAPTTSESDARGI